MLKIIKDIIRAPRVLKLNRDYERELDRQYVSYDSWIRQKEIEYLAGTLPNTDDVQVVGFDEVGKCGYAADVILFTSDRRKLASRALHAIISVFNEYPDTVMVYGDEDEYNSDRKVRMNPVFRPGWSPDNLDTCLYMGNVIAVKKDSIPSDCNDIYELVKTVSRGLTAKQVRHVDYVLFHNDYCRDVFFTPVKDGEPPVEYSGLVSILIPSKDNPQMVKQLFETIVNRTTGVSYEIIVLDNGSTQENKITIEQLIGRYDSEKKNGLKAAKYLYLPQDFNFSVICNRLAKEASGEQLLFLNDDVEIRDGKWMLKMLKYAQREHVGAVGAKLYYPESRMIQHCGITNIRLGPVHKLQFKDDGMVYYNHASDMDRDVIAVTGACLMISADKFRKIGGFDERFAVAFNDVDLCFRLYEAGLHNVVVNTTHLWHYESYSRGDDESAEKIERLKSERQLLYEAHPSLYGKDPYYHSYLTADILDSNYSFAYEYEYSAYEGTLKAAPSKVRGNVRGSLNECLMISLEQCGTLGYWLGPDCDEANKDKIYISGYSFVAGSDNSCFRFYLLFEGEKGTYIVPCNRLYRPDLDKNLDPAERPALCGFSVMPDTSGMEKGRYRVGVLAKGLASRMVLYGYTNRYIVNE